jgi:integrase
MPRSRCSGDLLAGLPGEALRVLLLTGQRPGEVAHMRHEHIADGWWTLTGWALPAVGWPGTKNSQTHRVFLPAAVQSIVAGIGTDDSTGFVFGQVPALDAAMRDICKALNVPRCTPHDLRRTHGTTITGLGFGREAMNRIQNHREGGIADVYDRHEYAEENKRIMEAVASRLIALAEGTHISSNVVSLHS